MEPTKKTKADPHDHNDHLPKDVLNLAQDENSFTDPLEQQLAKQNTSNFNQQSPDTEQNRETEKES